jgi:hypothetical protein
MFPFFDSEWYKNFKRIDDLLGPVREMQKILDSTEQFRSFAELLAPMQNNLIVFINKLKNDPEFNFLGIIDNDDITEDEIMKVLEIVDYHLDDLLEKLQLKTLWIGAKFALATPQNENPDNIRHFLISIRTIIEHLIDHLLAPDAKVKKWGKFKKIHDAFLSEYPKSDPTRIPRSIRIKFFCDKIEFNQIEEFTEREIKFIIDLYKNVCKIHSPKIELDTKELELLKLHIGVTIWFLSKCYFMIEEENNNN